jgi:hypothetical protein
MHLLRADQKSKVRPLETALMVAPPIVSLN